MPRKNTKNKNRNRQKKRSHRHHSNRRRHNHRHNAKVFEMDAFVCIRKQREGVGRVSKAGDKGSYLIAFKNGTWAYYRSSKIEAIDEEQYNAASEDFVIDKSLPSPSPSPAPSSVSMSMSPSPTPTPDPVTEVNDAMRANKNIKFRADQRVEIEAETDDVAEADSGDKKMEIRIGDGDENENKDEVAESVDAVVVEHEQNEEENAEEAVMDSEVKSAEIDDIEAVEPAEADASEDVNEKEKGADSDSAAVATVESVTVDAETVCNSETSIEVKTEENNNVKVELETDAMESKTEERNDAKRTEKATKKKEKAEKAKAPKKPELSTIAKKLKKFYKVADRREAAYLVMCDSRHDSLTLQSLYEYIAHFQGGAVSKKTVKGFFETMKPMGSNVVSFSNFVKAIDENGDVVAAYTRFKKSGTSRSLKK